MSLTTLPAVLESALDLDELQRGKLRRDDSAISLFGQERQSHGGKRGQNDDESAFERLASCVRTEEVARQLANAGGNTVNEAKLEGMDERKAAGLLKELARRGCSAKVESAFQTIRRAAEAGKPLGKLKSTYVYNAAIALLSDGGRGGKNTLEGGWKRGLALLQEMWDSGLEPTVHTYTSLMHALMRGGKLEAVIGLFEQMRDARVQPNVITYSTLISAYGKLGRWREVLESLGRMHDEGLSPNLWTYNNVMFALNSSQQWTRTLQVYEWLANENAKMNTFTFNAALNACSQLNSFNRAMDLAERMRSSGVELDEFTYGALICVCERTSHWREAVNLLHEASQSPTCPVTTVMCNTCISACLGAGEWKAADRIFSWMPATGCKPDVVTYTVMLGALNQGAQWHRALCLACSLLSSPTVKPDRIFALKSLDVLFCSGIPYLQRRALSLFSALVHRRLIEPLPSPFVSVPFQELELPLADLSFSTTCLCLYSWLRHLEVTLHSFSSVSGFPDAISLAANSTSGVSSTPPSSSSAAIHSSSPVMPALGESAEKEYCPPSSEALSGGNAAQGFGNHSVPVAQRALAEACQLEGFPFQQVQDAGGSPPRYWARTSELLMWLSDDGLSAFLPPFRTYVEPPRPEEWSKDDVAQAELDAERERHAQDAFELMKPGLDEVYPAGVWKGSGCCSEMSEAGCGNSLSPSAQPFVPGKAHGQAEQGKTRFMMLQSLAKILAEAGLDMGEEEFHKSALVMDLAKSRLRFTASGTNVLPPASALLLVVQGRCTERRTDEARNALASAAGCASGDVEECCSRISESIAPEEPLVTLVAIRKAIWSRLGGVPQDLEPQGGRWWQHAASSSGQFHPHSLIHDILYYPRAFLGMSRLCMAAGVICSERPLVGLLPAWPSAFEALTGTLFPPFPNESEKRRFAQCGRDGKCRPEGVTTGALCCGEGGT